MAERSLLYIYAFCNLGGVASVLKQRLPYLADAGFEVHGLFGRDYGGRDDLLESGMTEIEISPDVIARAASIAGNYDVVCVVDMPDVMDCFAQLAPDTRLIYEIHSGIEAVILKNSNQALTYCDKVVVPSQWMKKTILGFYPIVEADHISVCPNMVDADVFSATTIGTEAENSDGHVMWVGKIDDHKNWREGIEIFRLYGQENQSARAFLATGGRLTGELLNQVLSALEEAKLVDRCLWLHNVPYTEMPDLYGRVARSRGALIQCSKSESFGMVVHEAARCGVPAVSRRSGAVQEFVESGVSGFIYDDGDVETAARQLLELNSRPDIHQRILAGLQQQLEDYDPELLGSRYVQLLSEGLAHG